MVRGWGKGGACLWKYSSASTFRDSAMRAVPTWKRPSSDSPLTSTARSPAASASSCSCSRVETSASRHQPCSSSGASDV